VSYNCDVQMCKEEAVAIMRWPDDSRLPLYLCPDHHRYYKSIAGPHMSFEYVDSQPKART
jgi:hypothetical protein